jgi:hypothetical protein
LVATVPVSSFCAVLALARVCPGLTVVTAAASSVCVAVEKSRLKPDAAWSSADVIVNVLKEPGAVPAGVPIEIMNWAVATTDGVEASAEGSPLACAQLTGVMKA